MNQLRYLINAEVQKSSSVKQNNGTYINTYTKVNDYKVQLEEIKDDISFSIYGASINRMYKITSPFNELETFLSGKNNTSTDNISKYFILINQNRYKIVNVKQKYIEVEMI